MTQWRPVDSWSVTKWHAVLHYNNKIYLLVKRSTWVIQTASHISQTGMQAFLWCRHEDLRIHLVDPSTPTRVVTTARWAHSPLNQVPLGEQLAWATHSRCSHNQVGWKKNRDPVLPTIQEQDTDSTLVQNRWKRMGRRRLLIIYPSDRQHCTDWATWELALLSANQRALSR